MYLQLQVSCYDNFEWEENRHVKVLQVKNGLVSIVHKLMVITQIIFPWNSLSKFTGTCLYQSIYTIHINMQTFCKNCSCEVKSKKNSSDIKSAIKRRLLRNNNSLFVPSTKTSRINRPYCRSTFPESPSRVHNVPVFIGLKLILNIMKHMSWSLKKTLCTRLFTEL
jgi:hypothetical protein